MWSRVRGSTSGSGSASNRNEDNSSSSNPHHPHQAGSSSSASSNNSKKSATSKVTNFLKGLHRYVTMPVRCLDRKGLLFPRSSSYPTPSNMLSDDPHRQFQVILQAKDLSQFAISDKGSQELMKMMDESTAKLIFDKINERIFEVMVTNNGTKVVQSLCKFQSSLTHLADRMLSEPSELKHAASDFNGSDTVLELLVALTNIKSPHTRALVGVLAKFSIMSEARNEKLIMYCLNNLNSADNTAIYQEAIDSLVDLAKIKPGAEIILRLIQLVDNPLWDRLVMDICTKTFDLSENVHGCYVVQKVLDLKNPHFDELICTRARDHLLQLSKGRYGNYVVQKCLESGSMEIIVNELLITQRLYHLATDCYGQYVVQKVIQQTRKNNWVLFEQIKLSLEKHMKNLKGGPGVSVYWLLTRAGR